jgi:hypothetical protein
VLDHYHYSNLAIALTFEIGPKHLGALLDRLHDARIGLTAASHDELSRLAKTPRDVTSGLEDSISGSLHLLFVHDEPDLRRDVPAIPG